MTLIYLLPPPVSLLTGTTTPIYKLVHFIAPSAEVLEVWRGVLESYRENKSTGGMSYSFSGLAIKDGEVEGVEERVVKEEEVHRLCARLGMGMGRDEVGLVFRVSIPSPQGGIALIIV
jgi:phosphatidylinositol phospholipase C delta